MPDNPMDWAPDVNSSGRSREENRDYIKGLLNERASCERRGLEERVALIDAELARVGHRAAKPAERAERRPRSGRGDSRR